MKKIFIFQCVMAALMVNITILSAQNKKSSKVQIITRLTNKDAPVSDYAAVFVCEGRIIDSVHIKGVSQPITLEKGQMYTVYYKKPGSPDKCVIVDTHVPEEAALRPFRIYIHVELDPVFSKQKEDSDFPSAIIKYIEKNKNFEYIREYHTQTHGG